jgi:hypothetical protein
MALHAYQIWVLAVGGTGLCAWWLAVRPGASLRAIASPVCALIFVMTTMLAVLAVTGQSRASTRPRQALTAQTVVMGPVAMGPRATADHPTERPLRPAGAPSRTLP